jgi:hypothetical protein
MEDVVLCFIYLSPHSDYMLRLVLSIVSEKDIRTISNGTYLGKIYSLRNGFYYKIEKIRL